MSITKSITKSVSRAKSRGWTKTYWAVDIHDTMVLGNYKAGDIPREFYKFAKRVLQKLSQRGDIKLILYTCSHPHEIVEYLKFFEENGIHFDFVNENPEVKTDLAGYGCYDKKMYFNVLLDDKAGFDPETDWLQIKSLLRQKLI